MTSKINDNGIDRDMTKDEQVLYLAFQAETQAETQAQADAQTAKQTARQAVLDKLGLTAFEAAALFA